MRAFISRISVGVLLIAAVGVFAAGRGWLGEEIEGGTPLAQSRASTLVDDIDAAGRAEMSRSVADEATREILFGDFHIHTSFSQDAFMMSMPLTGGSGRHTVADACDFARYCSNLDFWSINDHAESSTPRRWRETIESIRRCDAVEDGSGRADLISFLGWEWSHMGTTPENHFGHRNVILRDLESDRIPTRPIASDSPADYFQSPSTLMLGLLPIIAADSNYLRYATYSQETASTPRCPDGVRVRDLPSECREYAATPGALFDKLDDWGLASIVIPHGTTWGMYTPQGSDWGKQLSSVDHDPVRQRLVEVYSGHGNIEPHRPWRAIDIAADGTRTCPPPRDDYLPACWNAGEIIRSRCEKEGEASEAECDARAIEARQAFADAPSGLGHLSIPGYRAEEWRDAGQCRDCFLPAFNYRPGSSVQSMLARTREGPDGEPLRFRFGFIGSSDTHTARPGNGYKDSQRSRMSDVRMARVDLPIPGPVDESVAHARVADPQSVGANDWIERDRAGSFYFTGGLVAVHASDRTRAGVWEALESRETYATSGPRILLWFDLVNPPGSGRGRIPMGGAVAMNAAPEFEVRAAGSREQLPGCAEETLQIVGAERLERLCGGECFRPADTRRRISRIEVIRIRPQIDSSESLLTRIEDPWKTLACPPDPDGCRVRFSDPEFATEGRDSVYYVRAIEELSLAVNGQTLRCEGEDCERMAACDPWAPESEDCLGEVEERAWSSPVFVDWSGSSSAGS
jgi:hypothetical protein